MKRRIKRIIKIKSNASRHTGHDTGQKTGHDAVQNTGQDTGYRDLFRLAGLLAVFTASFVALVVLQADRHPADAKQCGDNWLNVSQVNQGLYCCRIYSKEKKLIKKQAYMLPYRYWRGDQRELTSKVRKYDGDTISLEGGIKLLACDVPYQAELIEGADGPVWVTYDAVNSGRNMFSCEVYSAKNGRVVSSGAYVLKKYRWDSKKNKTVYEDVKDAAQFTDLFFYGGISIALTDKLVLMPAGVVDYCMGPKGGVRVQYDGEGNEIHSEEY